MLALKIRQYNGQIVNVDHEDFKTKAIVYEGTCYMITVGSGGEYDHSIRLKPIDGKK
jgi:hypothetical protein